MSIAITRAYVAVDGRPVHLRLAGKGRPLLLLHQSPRSSAELEPLIKALANRYLVIAPDTPGNGLSAPLARRDPEIEPFADNIAGVLTALGIGRAGVYGYHTGAAVAAAFALRHPQRAAFAVLNGLPGFNASERADLLARYLPPFVPHWDGSHLAWLWARLREQTIHFPWYEARPEARMDFDPPPPEALQEAVLDVLMAGDHYRDAYGAAFRMDGTALLPHLQMPTAVVATARDPLRPHLARCTVHATSIVIQELQPGQEPVEALIDHMAEMSGLASATPVQPGMDSHGYVGPAGAQLHVLRFAPAKGNEKQAPLLLLDGRHGSGHVLARVAQAAARSRTVLVPCLPGCGMSEDTEADLLDMLDVPEAETCMIGAPSPGLPLPPQAGGGHLLWAWQTVRDGWLFTGQPSRAGIMWEQALPDLAQLQLMLLACLKQRKPVPDARRGTVRLSASVLDPNVWRGVQAASVI